MGMHRDYERFLAQNKNAWTETTHRNYYYFLQRLPEPDDLQPSWIAKMLEEYADTTKSTWMSYLTKLGDFLERDLLEGISWPKIPEYHTPVTRKDLIDADMFKRLMRAANYYRDQVLLEFAIESGARRGEMVGLQCEDIVFDNDGLAFVTLKTGKGVGNREIPIYECVPRLKQYLEMHPTGKGAFFRGIRLPHAPISYDVPYQVMTRLFNGAGIPLPPCPVHITRHTRATELATILTEAEMRLFFGWKKSSRMPEVYIHLANADLRGSFKRKVLGMEPEQQIQILNARRCPSCQTRNTSTAKVCKKCGLILDVQVAMERQRERRMGDALARMLASGTVSREELQEIVAQEVRRALNLPSAPPEESTHE